MEKANLKGLTLKELEDFAVSIGEQKFRGKQLFDWLYRKEANSLAEMTSLSKMLREKLSTVAAIDSIKLVKTQTSQFDGTTKFLFELTDGKHIESVLIPPQTAFKSPEAKAEEEQKRLTLCISTQVGCPLECKFCATAAMGFSRNLTVGEILDQIFQAKKISGKHISNLVYMGMGEPLLNYENVMKSIEIITTSMGIAARRITISTAGWVPNIIRMADEKRKIKLAISLHTLNDNARTELMPINKRYPLDKLLDAVEYYYKKVKRRITYEYILFDSWNDSEADIIQLIKLAKRVPCKINIIPFHNSRLNQTTRLKPTPPERIDEFVHLLRKKHITVFVRSSAGADIEAACGQLAVQTEHKQKSNEFSFIHKPTIEEIST